MKSCAIVSTTILGKKILPIIKKKLNVKFLITLDKSISKKKSLYFDLENYYKRNNVQVIKIKSINSKKIINLIKKNNIDYILQLDWSEKFTNSLIKAPKVMCIGLHPSPLPKGRGAAILNWKIILREYGDWGCSLFKMDNNFDSGPIIDCEKFGISRDDDIISLYKKFHNSAKKILKNNLISFASGKIILKDNNFSKYKYYKKRTPKQSEIFFSWSPIRILSYYKALQNPFPNIFFQTNNKFNIKVLGVKILNRKYNATCGTLIKFLNNNYLIVIVRKQQAIKIKIDQKYIKLLKKNYKYGNSDNLKSLL